jgi:type II secretory pathway pseudopilin PulG
MRREDLRFAICDLRLGGQPCRPRTGGGGLFAFTLIEMIGALAVVAILASVLVPVVIRQIDRAAWTQEVANLGAISNAIVLQVVRNKQVSATTAWPTDTAGWLNMSPASIATNPRGYSRAFLIDPAGWFGLVSLPYSQTTNGTVITNTARMMIVSTIATALPVSPATPLSASQFNDIWITQDRAKPIDSVGNSIWSSWNGRGEDVVIQRINLQPLFHRVILYNRDGVTDPAYFSIDKNGPVQVISNRDAYYLDGSLLGIYNTSTLVSTEIINRDMSRVFETGSWIADIGAGPLSSSSSNFQDIATAFVASSPQAPGVADALTTFMNAYSSWSGTCFTNANLADGFVINSVINCFVGQGTPPCALLQNQGP